MIEVQDDRLLPHFVDPELRLLAIGGPGDHGGAHQDADHAAADLAEGGQVADIIVAVAGIDPVMGGVDR